MRLSEIEADGHLQVPPELGRAIKALAADERHAKAWRFIIDQLCGQRRLSFVPGLPEGRDMMLWREGRRFVGEWLVRIVETPIPDETPPEPPARTMAERQRRRAKRDAP